MTQNERKEAIKCIKTQLKNGYVDIDGIHYEKEIEVLREAMSALVAIEQYKWERYVAIGQLAEIGLSLGQDTFNIQKAINTYKNIPYVIQELECKKEYWSRKCNGDRSDSFDYAVKLIKENLLNESN